MTSREFIRRAKDYARRTGQSFRFDPTHGKGSHGRVYVGTSFATVQRGELKRGDWLRCFVHRPQGVLSHVLCNGGRSRRGCRSGVGARAYCRRRQARPVRGAYWLAMLRQLNIDRREF